MAKSNNNGVGLGMIIFLIFMTLKLTNSIDWSWWWVTAPLWAPIAIILIVLALLFILKR